MKKFGFFIVVLCLLLRLQGGECMEVNESLVGQSYEFVHNLLGAPSASQNVMHVWMDETGGRLICGFRSDGTELKLKEYVHLSAEGEWIAGTIPPELCANVLLKRPEEVRYQGETVFDIGSGITIPAVITGDGYILFTGARGPELFDCFTQKYQGVLFYRLCRFLGIGR